MGVSFADLDVKTQQTQKQDETSALQEVHDSSGSQNRDAIVLLQGKQVAIAIHGGRLQSSRLSGHRRAG